MKRKMLYLIKTFLSILIIVSFVFPSYAAVTSSDGSAFVTKAEFDSNLSNFNSRLTVFESSINSKIDSHVTSYLEKNGIWSRKEMVFSSNFTYNATKKAYQRKLTFDSSYSSASYGYNTKFSNPDNFGQLGVAVFSVRQDTGAPTIYNKNFKPVKVIDEITKSGLMHLVVEVYCLDSYTRSGCSCYINATSLLDHSLNAPGVKASLCFCEADKNAVAADINLDNPGEKGRLQFQRMDWFNDAAYNTSTTTFFTGTTAVETGISVLYFFVTKGNSLWQYINGSGGFNSPEAADTWKNKATSFSWNCGSSTLPIGVYETAGVY